MSTEFVIISAGTINNGTIIRKEWTKLGYMTNAMGGRVRPRVGQEEKVKSDPTVQIAGKRVAGVKLET